MLSSWGVAFEGVDVEAHPERKADLERHGIPRVPATIVGERSVHGWNPHALAELVGVRYETDKRLTPDELKERLERVLTAAQRAVRQVPRGGLEMKGPGRDRTLRQLAFHIFRLSLAFRDGREQGVFPESWLLDRPSPSIRDAEDIARYGDEVRARLAEHFGRPGWSEGTIQTYYGPQSAHDLLERTTWHAAQHLRQVYWFLERQGVTPSHPLGDTDYAQLPIPREVWS